MSYINNREFKYAIIKKPSNFVIFLAEDFNSSHQFSWLKHSVLGVDIEQNLSAREFILTFHSNWFLYCYDIIEILIDNLILLELGDIDIEKDFYWNIQISDTKSPIVSTCYGLNTEILDSITATSLDLLDQAFKISNLSPSSTYFQLEKLNYSAVMVIKFKYPEASSENIQSHLEGYTFQFAIIN